MTRSVVNPISVALPLVLRRHSPRMLDLSPKELMAVLRTAGSPQPDRHLDSVLGEFRRRWLALAHRRRPEWRDDAEDAVQAGLIDLLRPATLDSVRETSLLEPFAAGLFWNKLRAMGRLRRRDLRRRGPESSPCGPPQ